MLALDETSRHISKGHGTQGLAALGSAWDQALTAELGLGLAQ